MSEPLLTIESADFDRAVRVLSGGNVGRAAAKPINTALKQSGNLVRKNVRGEAKAHRRSGKMSRNRMQLKTKGAGLNTVTRFSALSPANLVVGGVREHDITPGKTMPIHGEKGRGVVGFATAVHNRGFPGDPFVNRGIQHSIRGINDLLDAAGQTVVRDLARQINMGGF